MGIFAVDGKLARFLNRLGSLFVLNILTVICCVPVFTAGAAMTALYTSTLRITRKEEGHIVTGYFKAFAANFKQATKVWLLGGAAIAFMAFDIWLLKNMEGTFGQVYRILLFLLILFVMMQLLYAFALMARFQNTVGNTLKNAIVLSVGKIGPALVVLLAMALPVLLLMISYRLVVVDILLGISGPVYLTSFYFTSLFKRFEKEEPTCD